MLLKDVNLNIKALLNYLILIVDKRLIIIDLRDIYSNIKMKREKINKKNRN